MVLRDDGAIAAQEILATIGQLMNTLNSERQVVLVSEERRREAEIENARLEAELEGERALRRRTEEELEQLRAELAARRKRAEADLARIYRRREARDRNDEAEGAEGTGGGAQERASNGGQVAAEFERALSDERIRRREAEEELARVQAQDRARKERARDELEKRRGQGAPEELVQRAREGLERVLGETLDAQPEPPPPPLQSASTEGESLSNIWTPSGSLPEPETSAGGPESGPGDADGDAEGDAPPLPPGWRYASDLPSSEARRRWRLPRRAR
jgi:hypothetical protein